MDYIIDTLTTCFPFISMCMSRGPHTLSQSYKPLCPVTSSQSVCYCNNERRPLVGRTVSLRDVSSLIPEPVNINTAEENLQMCSR